MRAQSHNNATEQTTADETNVYGYVYRALVWGMLGSTALFIFGIVRALLKPQYVPLSSSWIKQHYHWHVIVNGVVSLDPTTIMLLATALLILTPIARVVVSIYAFAIDGDHKFVAVTSIVLLMIVLAIVLGLLGLK